MSLIFSLWYVHLWSWSLFINSSGSKLWACISHCIAYMSRSTSPCQRTVDVLGRRYLSDNKTTSIKWTHIRHDKMYGIARKVALKLQNCLCAYDKIKSCRTWTCKMFSPTRGVKSLGYVQCARCGAHSQDVPQCWNGDRSEKVWEPVHCTTLLPPILRLHVHPRTRERGHPALQPQAQSSAMIS